MYANPTSLSAQYDVLNQQKENLNAKQEALLQNQKLLNKAENDLEI